MFAFKSCGPGLISTSGSWDFSAPCGISEVAGEVYGDLNLWDCLIYLDDIIIFSSIFDEHMGRLQAVFQRL